MLFNPRTHPRYSGLYSDVTRQWAKEIYAELRRVVLGSHLSDEMRSLVVLPSLEDIEDLCVLHTRVKARHELLLNLRADMEFAYGMDEEIASGRDDLYSKLSELATEYEDGEG